MKMSLITLIIMNISIYVVHAEELPNVSDILQILINAEENIESGEFRFNHAFNVNTDFAAGSNDAVSQNGTITGICYFENDKKRYEITSEVLYTDNNSIVSNEVIVRINGIEYSYENITDLSGLLHPSGSIKEFSKPFKYDPYIKMTTRLGKSLSHYLQNDSTYEIVGFINYNSMNCIELELIDTDTQYEMIVYVSPEYDYLPLYIRYFVEQTGARIEQENTYQKQDGIIILKKSECETVLIRNEEVLSRRNEVFSIDSAIVNISIADSLFETPFPPGLKVMDNRIGKWITIE